MSAPLSRQQLQRLSNGTLAAVQRRWGALNKPQARWLTRQGVSAAAILEPTPIGAAQVRFLDGGTFTVSGTDGTGALTFRVQNVDGDDFDLVAWSPGAAQIGSWYGRAFALGQDWIDNPATYFAGDALRVHAGPLAWLKANRDGICIIKPELTYAMLRSVPRVSFADVDITKADRGAQEPRAPAWL
jgi:hypothetical protein